ncbi:MAG: T9SS type A sorting domain-containing protein [Firmicutes bacterium]|nr:T9SS type A sorting domain-containing protein [Bacillota bacterium]
MSRILFSFTLCIAFSTTLVAQITREQADAIVLQHIKNELISSYKLYVYNHEPSGSGIVIATYNEEKIKIKYACWFYYLNENPEITVPCQHRYLLVKENNGNLLEIITSKDLGIENFTEWEIILGITDKEKEQNIVLYPNPTTSELRITNYELGSRNVEIFDAYGRKQKARSEKQIAEDIGTIDISNLPVGIYFVIITTETGKITKKIIKN